MHCRTQNYYDNYINISISFRAISKKLFWRPSETFPKKKQSFNFKWHYILSSAMSSHKICRWNFEDIPTGSRVLSEKLFLDVHFEFFSMTPEVGFWHLYFLYWLLFKSKICCWNMEKYRSWISINFRKTSFWRPFF